MSNWFMDALDDAGEYYTDAAESLSGFTDDLGWDLDFGANTPKKPQTLVSKSPELDLQAVDRSNPTNSNFASIGGLPPMVVYVAGGLAAIVVLKKMDLF